VHPASNKAWSEKQNKYHYFVFNQTQAKPGAALVEGTLHHACSKRGFPEPIVQTKPSPEGLKTASLVQK
jgi:hypothetical protein